MAARAVGRGPGQQIHIIPATFPAGPDRHKMQRARASSQHYHSTLPASRCRPESGRRLACGQKSEQIHSLFKRIDQIGTQALAEWVWSVNRGSGCLGASGDQKRLSANTLWPSIIRTLALTAPN